jgi:hypothetical protein
MIVGDYLAGHFYNDQIYHQRMTDFANMETGELMDLLAKETGRFTQLMTAKEFTPEYEQCKDRVRQIMAVITSRKDVVLPVLPAILTEPSVGI